MITVRRITADDAALLREIRLRALSDSPGAFSSTYAREFAFDTSEWQARARSGSSSPERATFFAIEDDRCLGLIGCFRESHELPACTIVSMWVAPEARRMGVGRRLIQAAEEWARAQGSTQLLLDVVENNANAIAFYQNCGFEFTGKTDRYPNNPALRELFMAKLL